jgi:hypothetical protein
MEVDEILFRYFDVEGADLGCTFDSCHVDFRFLAGGLGASTVETVALVDAALPNPLFQRPGLLVNAVHQIAANAIVEPPWRRPLQAFKPGGPNAGLLQSPVRTRTGDPSLPSDFPRVSRQCLRNGEFLATTSRCVSADKLPRGLGTY